MTEVTKGKVTKELKRPSCRWCGKQLKANYRRICAGCGHAAYLHSQMREGKCAGADRNCSCTKPQWNAALMVEDYKPYAEREFPKVLQGYGKYNGGKFCTLDCALRWANKYA